MPNTIEDVVIVAIENYRGRLPDEFVDEYISLARHGECVIAFENLCDQLFDFDVIPNDRELAFICKVGRGMSIDPRRWQFLASPDSLDNSSNE